MTNDDIKDIVDEIADIFIRRDVAGCTLDVSEVIDGRLTILIEVACPNPA